MFLQCGILFGYIVMGRYSLNIIILYLVSYYLIMPWRNPFFLYTSTKNIT